MASEGQVIQLVNDFLRVESSNVTITYHCLDSDTNRKAEFQKQLSTIFTALSNDQKKAALRTYLMRAESQTNLSQMKFLLLSLTNLMDANVIPARLLCEQIISCERLVYESQNFWIECFELLRTSMAPRSASAGVDYKGVREIMKGCREKTLQFPHILTSNTLPQMLAVERVIEYIFDRNACLLPAYFISNEFQKPENPETHWKIANLIGRFLEDVRWTAQMLTIIGHSDLLPMVEYFFNENMNNPWRLDEHTLKFNLKGNLPYNHDVTKPQIKLFRFVLEQPYSREMVCCMLNLQKQNKQRCAELERHLVWLIMSAIERTEAQDLNIDLMDANGNPTNIHWLWLHLSAQLIYFTLMQYAQFPNIVTALHEQLSARPNLRKGRDHVMWVLLQYISGSIQRNPLSNYLPVLKLYDCLYTEKEPLPVPDFTKTSCTRQMAATCIWIHILRKGRTEQVNINRPIPPTLQKHHAFLQELASNTGTFAMGNDYRIALLCNAYSTNQDFFSRPMAALVDTILGNQKNAGSNSGSATASGGGGSSNAPTTEGGAPASAAGAGTSPNVPLSMVVLDNFTVHSKMSLIHSIGSNIIKHAHTKTNIAPILVETYARLLVYIEIESLGIKGLLSQLLPTVFKSHAWGILHTLLEMFSYRIHHIQPHYRIQLMSNLPALASVPHTNQMQLHLCVESTALRLITGLGSVEMQSQISKHLSEPKTSTSIVSTESEELNRALILTLARSMHITASGNDPVNSAWCKDLLNSIMQYTPHTWAPHTLQCFPPVLCEFFAQNSQNIPKENKQLLKKSVEEEFRNWVSMSNENDIIAHFSVAVNPPLFFCLIFKMIFETDGISPVAYKILERIGARGIYLHLRKLIDYLMFEVTSGASGHVNKCVNTINDMIWKYHVVTIDRLILCLALRTQEGNGAQIRFYIIQLVLLKSSEFRNRVQEFVKNSPEHWKQTNYHEKNFAFHQKYPEKFSPDESHPALPVYFGNVCLRFLPVLDIVIHRFLEVDINMMKPLEAILEHLGCLYKFHDRPITYLYNTLHYYERKIRESPILKKKLVEAVIGSLKEIRPPNWAFTEQFQQEYLQKQDNVTPAPVSTGPDGQSQTQSVQQQQIWQPELSYYMALVRRLVETIDGDHFFYVTDWRFNEFFNSATHALYVSCVELLALPVPIPTVANNLFDVVTKGYPAIPINKFGSWINAIGLILANLPESAWSIMYDQLQMILVSAPMLDWPYRQSPFEMFNMQTTTEAMLDKSYVVTLALSHSILQHFGVGQITTLSDFVRKKLQPIVRTEQQLVYVCHLIAPFLQRLNTDCPWQVNEITTIIYELLETIDEAYGSKPLQFMDPICEMLYHIKYMFIGDSMKTELEAKIRRLRPALQKRLRFITRMNVDTIVTECTNDGNAKSNNPHPTTESVPPVPNTTNSSATGSSA